MNIVVAASECNPFAKTGGLADVIGALPQALAALRSDSKIIVILPKFGSISKDLELQNLGLSFELNLGGLLQKGTVWQFKKSSALPGNVEHYFIENDYYFNRSGLYSDVAGDYADNAARFIFYQRGVLEVCRLLNFAPDIVHCHDWQTGLIPCYLKTLYAQDVLFAKSASIFTIHNIAYQGMFPQSQYGLTGLEDDLFTPEKLEYYGQLNLMKAGLIYADKISTVSQTYAQEIYQSAEFGRGMEGILQSRKSDLSGIVNALDTLEWDAQKDPYIAKNFDVNSLQNRAECKKDLQKKLGFSLEADTCLIGMVSRLDAQKGFNFVADLFESLNKQDIKVQWVVLGSGDSTIKKDLENLAKKYPKNFALDSSFNVPLGHQIYAGADIFFMPSLFEPCGISQMIAMRYGALPVVTSTGGLKDTVRAWHLDNNDALGFVAPQRDFQSVEQALLNALKVYKNPVAWQKIIKNAMFEEFSWEKSAKQYWILYQSVVH